MGYPHDKILECIKTDTTAIYLPAQSFADSPEKMLVILPNLSLNGAMTVFMELLPLIMKRNRRVYVLAPEDGTFRRKLTEQGIVVFIRPYVRCSSDYRRFLQEGFDLVFINTAGCFYYAYYYINQPTKVLWWLHETREQLDTLRSEFLNLSLLSDNFTLLGVTNAVIKDIREQFGIEIANLPMPIVDCFEGTEIHSEGKVTFFAPAAYTYIKGQDILLQAISMLPKEYQEKARFIFCGYCLPGQEKYYEAIKKIAQKLPSVIFLEELDRNEVYEWYKRCDCVIAPSRVDATPTTIVEAMMHKRLCIVSDAAGISRYMTHCVNGFIFTSASAEELFKILLYVIESADELSAIAEAGRKVYEDNFSVECVSHKLDDIMKNI